MRRNRFPVTSDTPFHWQVIGSLAPFIVRYKGRVLIALLCLVGAKIATVGMPFVLKYLVDSLNSPQQQMIAIPIGLIVMYGVLRLATTLLGEVRDTVFGYVTEGAMQSLSLKVFNHLHRLDLAFHLDRQTGGLSRDIERGTSGIAFFMRFMVFNIVPTLLEFLFVIGVLLTQYGVNYATVIFSAVVLYIGFSVKATDWRTQYVKLMNKADSNSSSRAIDSLLNYETVKYFGNEQFESERYNTDLTEWRLARQQNRLSLFALNGGQALIIAVAMTAMVWIAAQQVAEGSITIGDFVLLNTFAIQIFLPLNFLGFVYREIKGSLANIEQLFGLLKTPAKVVDAPDAQPLKVNKGSMAFEEVSFGYNDNRQILDNVSFTVNSGEKVAIVGESGSGKSTLIKLLFRFYDYQSGSIKIDGQALTAVTQDSLRQHIAIVPQDTVLFNDTLLENIRYGRPDASMQEIERAVQMAHLSHFVETLPDGYDTQVGERGLKLSGGEKQRVSIARALLKGSPILVFDEATSSLDSHAEQSILSALNEIAIGHTSLVIAHRLSTIVDADKILVMQKGRVIEQGSHAELLSNQQHYAKMWQLQQADGETKHDA